MPDIKDRVPILLAISFFMARLVLLITMPLEGLVGHGDFIHFFNMASMGAPFIDLWVEFPPFFPFLSSLVYTLAGGREHTYDYLLVLVLTSFQAGNIALFTKLALRSKSETLSFVRIGVYFIVLLVLAYGWWYFDPIAVFFTLLGLHFFLSDRDIPGALAVAFGVLVKLFPAMLLVVVWKMRDWRRAVLISLTALLPVVFVYAALYAVSPDYTRASIRSQGSKGSWETVWALVDGNMKTGNFGAEIERYDPQKATVNRGNPARVPSWLTLLLIAAGGFVLFLRTELKTDIQAIAFLLLTWCLFDLWSPGWSPQWVLYLLPLVLLIFPLREGIYLASILVLINLLEWPVLLARGYFWGLWLTVPLRSLIFLLIVLRAWQINRQDSLEGLLVEAH